MTGYVYPVDNWQTVDGVKYTGRRLRQILGSIWGGRKSGRVLGIRSGVPAGTPIIVAATATVWTVNPHNGWIDAEAATIAGGYGYSFDADVTGAMTAPHATKARIDLISVQISDPSEGDGTASPQVGVVYTTGTAADVLTAPATPARSLALAQINVASAAAGSPPSVSFIAPFIVATGGVIPVRSQAERDAIVAYAGQFVSRLDAGARLEYYDGTAWQTAAEIQPVWQSITAFGTGAGPDGGVPPKYRVWQRGLVELEGIITSTSTFAGSGVVIATLPAGARPDQKKIFPASHNYFTAADTDASVASNARMEVHSDGTILLYAPAGAITYTGLDHIRFYTTS